MFCILQYNDIFIILPNNMIYDTVMKFQTKVENNKIK